MKTFSLTSDLEKALKKERNSGHSIGFIPTMGALHEGHLSLIRESKRANDVTVCSIFVNPVQFNNKADLEKYPRDLEHDLRLLLAADCDYIFVPSAGEVYPDGPGNPDIDLTPLDRVLEGKYRPGHFMGVAIVVKRFFEIVQPDNAYFGKKDYQQLLVIKRLVSMLGLPVRITGCPTLREPDGLAMSSRNLRLTPAERKTAPLIYETLCRVKERAGQFPVGELTQWAKDRINKVPSFKVEYFEIVDKEDLHALTDWNDPEKALACTAVFLGDVRLIDNFELFS